MYHLLPHLGDGHVQGRVCGVVQGGSVPVRAALQQQRHHGAVARVRGVVQRGPARPALAQRVDLRPRLQAPHHLAQRSQYL